MSKRPFAVLSVAVLLGVSLRFQVDPAAHAQGPAPSVVTFDWATVGDPGNACDPHGTGRCFGAVGYAYRIAKHEVTDAQYAAFLNAKAASDPLGLYNPDMATWGGITRSGSAGSYTYSAIPGRENAPVVLVSYFDALRFTNWLHNGQGDGDTETGAYTLLGGTPTPSNSLVARNAGATRVWLLQAAPGQALDTARLGDWHQALEQLGLVHADTAPLDWLEHGHD